MNRQVWAEVLLTDDDDRDGRSAVARGYVMASRATSIGLQMAIPAGVGWWLDSKWNTAPWLMIVGIVLGFLVVILEIVRIVKESNEADSRSSGQSGKGQDGSRR